MLPHPIFIRIYTKLKNEDVYRYAAPLRTIWLRVSVIMHPRVLRSFKYQYSLNLLNTQQWYPVRSWLETHYTWVPLALRCALFNISRKATPSASGRRLVPALWRKREQPRKLALIFAAPPKASEKHGVHLDFILYALFVFCQLQFRIIARSFGARKYVPQLPLPNTTSRVQRGAIVAHLHVVFSTGLIGTPLFHTPQVVMLYIKHMYIVPNNYLYKSDLSNFESVITVN